MKHLIVSFLLSILIAGVVHAEAPTTRPADFKPTTPKELVGKWIYGSISPRKTTAKKSSSSRSTTAASSNIAGKSKTTAVEHCKVETASGL